MYINFWEMMMFDLDFEYDEDYEDCECYDVDSYDNKLCLHHDSPNLYCKKKTCPKNRMEDGY